MTNAKQKKLWQRFSNISITIIAERQSDRDTTELTRNVAVTFWSGIVLDISLPRMSIGTPPSSVTCGPFET
jgi:hypothetical protein